MSLEFPASRPLRSAYEREVQQQGAAQLLASPSLLAAWAAQRGISVARAELQLLQELASRERQERQQRAAEERQQEEAAAAAARQPSPPSSETEPGEDEEEEDLVGREPGDLEVLEEEGQRQRQQRQELQQERPERPDPLGTRLLQAAAQQAAGTGAAGGASSWAAAAAAGTAATAGAAAATTAQPAAFGHARRLAAAYVQRAGIRTKHAKHALNLRHAGGRATPLRRALRLLGRAAGATAVGVPLAGVAALAWKGREEGADVWEVLHSLPRTARIVWWGGWATWKYKALAAAHGGDTSSVGYQQGLSELHQHAATKLLLAVQANGGIYIKAGQLMVSLNAAPAQYRSILQSLQDKVPPRPFAEVDCTLQQELGAPAAQLFAEFEAEATAAASLAQVHRAVLHDGTPVAVKVQYPGLQAAVAADLATMLTLADAAFRLFPATSWRWLFEELRRQLKYELDFTNEARNAAQLAQCMAGRPDVAVPRTYPALCTPRVLAMEWIEGCKVTDVECLERQGFEPRAVGQLLLDAFAQMTYQDGFTHGDPHPGNIMVRARPQSGPSPLLLRLLGPQRPQPQLVLLDHGVYISLPDTPRRLYCQLWGSFVLGDMQTARLAATGLAGEQAGRILPELLRPRDWHKVPREERQRVRQESGVNSFADVAKLLEGAPKPLLDTLRLGAVVRHSATLLGATLGDRLRVNAKWALHGMYAQHAQQGTAGAAAGADARQLEFVGGLQSRLARWRLAAQVGLLRFAFWLGSLVHSATTYLVPMAE